MASAHDDAVEANAGHQREMSTIRATTSSRLASARIHERVFAPGSVNVIAGSGCGVRLGAPGPFGGVTAVKFVLTSSSRGASRTVAETPEDSLAIAFARARGPARYPGSLAGQVELVEEILNGKAPPSELFLPQRVRYEVEKERRQRISSLLERKQVALFEAHTRAEVDAARS